MYLYIYDSFLNHRKYFNTLNKIESRLADLEIKGKICRLSLLKNMNESIEDGIKQGVKTIIAVGDDSTFSKVVNIIANMDVTLGIIPVGNKSKIATILGIPEAEKACDIISQRLIKKLDLGQINHHYFIDSAIITNSNAILELDNYQISPVSSKSIINISNLGFLSAEPNLYKEKISVPTDGLLEAVVSPIKEGLFNKSIGQPSIFPFKKLIITSKAEPISITIDQQTVFKTPVEVTVAPKKLNVIVGSKRLFK